MNRNFRHWFACLRGTAQCLDASVCAGFYAETQPNVNKLTDNDVRKLIVSVGRAGETTISLDLIVKDPQRFLADLEDGVAWVSGASSTKDGRDA